VAPAGPVTLGGPKQRAVLGVLLLDAGRVVSTDRLAAALWGDDPPDSAVNVLQGHVRDLRRLLGRDVLVTRAPGYLMPADAEQIDARCFERLACEGRRLLTANPSAARARLREALDLWRGPVLADIAYARPPGEITRLEELRLTALEDRLDADLALGAHAEVASELAALRASDPGRERLCGQLMLALYRSGRQEEALAAYRDLRDRLREELSIDPSPELQRLERSILRQEPSLLLPPPPSSLVTPPSGAAVAPPSGAPVAPPSGAAAAPPLGVPAARPARQRGRRGLVLATAAAVALAGISTLGVLRIRGEPAAQPPSPCLHAGPPPQPRQLGPGQGVLATVAHSCDANSEGVVPRAGPSRDSPPVLPNLNEGTPIRILCQNRHGGLVIDNALRPGPHPSSTVWDRLDNGTWISDLYTSLPKPASGTPPLGLRDC
jgi:DNA-binding SARP family transcriptional activator